MSVTDFSALGAVDADELRTFALCKAKPCFWTKEIPASAQGQGFAAKWWPIEDSEFYISGVLNDANGNPSRWDFLGLDWGSFKIVHPSLQIQVCLLITR